MTNSEQHILREIQRLNLRMSLLETKQALSEQQITFGLMVRKSKVSAEITESHNKLVASYYEEIVQIQQKLAALD